MSELDHDARRALRVAHGAHQPTAQQLAALRERVLLAAQVPPALEPSTLVRKLSGTPVTSLGWKLWLLMAVGGVVAVSYRLASDVPEHIPSPQPAVMHTPRVTSAHARPRPADTRPAEPEIALARDVPRSVQRSPVRAERRLPARHTATATPSPKPMRAVVDEADQPRSLEVPAATAPTVHTAPALATQPHSIRQQSPRGSNEDTLGQELAAINNARALLDQGALQPALTQLLAYQREFPSGTLREEALAIKARALCKLGRLAEAGAVFRSLLLLAPRSPHLSKLRAVCPGLVER